MRSRRFFEQLLGVEKPWEVSEVELQEDGDGAPGWGGAGLPSGEVVVHVSHVGEVSCPKCGQACAKHDGRWRTWRHLDTMRYRTKGVARVPRARCVTCGVHQVSVPWAEEFSRFTADFEAFAIDCLRAMSASDAARLLRISWNAVDGIMARAVKRGLLRRRQRGQQGPRESGVDETSFKRGHEYVSVVSDAAQGTVLHVADGRDRAALDGYFREVGEAGCARIEVVSMDMWAAYIASTKAHTDAAVVFDKFHIAQHLGSAVDEVRRAEQRQLLKAGDRRLTGSRYVWLRNPHNMSHAQWRDFDALRGGNLKMARAWALKEQAMSLWGYQSRGWAVRMWRKWHAWAVRCRLPAMVKVARMIKRHWDGVINAATTNVTNAMAESINAKIQRIKRMACGYRNRFRHAIYFHLGGLDLYPETMACHMKG